MKANLQDKKLLVGIITTTFDSNPSVNITIGNIGNRSKKLKRLAEYAFIKAVNRDGAYVSVNKKGVALCYRSTTGSGNIREMIAEIRFALVLPVKKVFQTLKREKYIKKNRFPGEHIYFWFLGVEKGGGRAGFELANYFLEISDEENIPILLETSVLRNKKVYERFGFEVYHKWANSGDGNTLWFMKREPKKQLK